MTEFVGRTSELAGLRSAIDAARAGQGGLVLIAGEPGIGKTRLAEEAGDYAIKSGAIVVWGRGTELEGSPAYWPWIQALRPLVINLSHLQSIAEVGEAAPEILRLLPDLRAAESNTEPPKPGDRFRLLDAVSQLLQVASWPNGMVIVLDDLQWFDRPSMVLLHHMATALRDLRLLVIATYRDVGLGRGHPLSTSLPRLTRERSVQRMKLKGLDVDDALRFLDGAGASGTQAELARNMREQTGGNPFFLAELARLWLAEGKVHPRTLPQSVREAIGRRLDTLSKDCTRALRIAALLGREFDLSLLAETAQVPVEAMMKWMDEAEAGALLTVQRDPPSSYGFVHDLVRETVYQQLPTAVRVQLHRRAAESLEIRKGSLAALAYHWFESAAVGGWDRAAAYASQAATEAMQQLAYEEAARLWGMALTALAEKTGEELRRCQLLLELAEAQYCSGDLTASVDSCTAAAELARVIGRLDLQAEAALVVRGVDDYWLRLKQRILCEEALASLGDQEPALRARVLAQLATIVGGAGKAQALEQLSREAMQLASRSGDKEALIAAIHARHSAVTGPDGVGERLALAGRLIELSAQPSRPHDAVWGYLWRTDALFQLGELGALPGELAELEVLVERLRQPLFRWHLVKCQAALALVTGRFDDAQRLADESLTFGRAGQYRMAELLARALSGIVAFARGSPVEMERFIAAADQPRFSNFIVLSVVTSFELALGRYEEARLRFNQLMVEYPRMAKTYNWLLVTDQLAEVASELGTKEQQTLLYESLLPYIGYFACDGAGVTWCRGSVARSVGLLAASLGLLDQADGHLERAVEINRRAGATPSVAYSLLGLAAVLIRKSQFARARDLAHDASRIAARLGMKPVMERSGRLLEELDRSGPRLSHREAEIAGLVGRGLANRAIADLLHLSERTAENHVKHILDKLGFSSRSQIAAWAFAEGLVSRAQIDSHK